MQRILSVGASPFSSAQIRSVSLVHGHKVGQFHHAALHALQLIARAGKRDQQEEVHHVVHRGFGLAHTNGLDENVLESCRLA